MHPHPIQFSREDIIALSNWSDVEIQFSDANRCQEMRVKKIQVNGNSGEK